MEIACTKKSLPQLLREAGAEGRMEYRADRGGVMKWVTTGGDVMSPGEAAQRFLPPCGTCGVVWPRCSHV